VDMSASLAALVGIPLEEDDAPDSWNVLPALLGTSPAGRPQLVEQAGFTRPSGRDMEVHRAQRPRALRPVD